MNGIDRDAAAFESSGQFAREQDVGELGLAVDPGPPEGTFMPEVLEIDTSYEAVRVGGDVHDSRRGRLDDAVEQ